MSDGDGAWVDAVAVSALERGDVTAVMVGRRMLAIYDAADGLYATLAQCTHGGANLCDGYFEGHVIECPLHQGCFDIRTGRALYAPATRDLRVVPVRVRGAMVQVQM